MRILLLILWLALPTLAWGEQGHRVVGQIAYDGLTRQARAEVDRLLEVGLPSLGRRFPSLAQASVACESIPEQPR